MGRGWLLVIVVVAGGAACSESQSTAEPPFARTVEATFIGELESGEARIAIVQDDLSIQAYVCGRGATLESHTRWFEGELHAADSGTVELANDGWRLHVIDDAHGLRGELIAPNGEPQSWSAARADGELTSEIGLYESFDTGCRSGVIVWQALEGPGCRAQGAWCDDTGTRGQVTPAECTANEPLRVFGDDYGERVELIAERVRGS